MAALLMSALAPVLTFAILLTLASAQNKSAGYSVADEQGWSQFVKEAAKGDGGSPADMSEFMARVNSNMNKSTGGGTEEIDPQLVADIRAFDQSNGSNTEEKPETKTKTETETETETKTGMKTKLDAGSSITAESPAVAMIAAANRRTMAPGEAPLSGAFSVKVVGVVGGLLPAIAVCFVL